MKPYDHNLQSCPKMLEADKSSQLPFYGVIMRKLLSTITNKPRNALEENNQSKETTKCIIHNSN